MRFNLCILSMLCLLVDATAQKTYKPGDTVTNLRQYVPNPKKLVIFDFWALSCSVCVEQFPKLDSLQRIFDDEIDIILVNQDIAADSARVEKVLRRTNLRSIIGDSHFVKSFPHVSIPHHVWVNNVGKIVGQTHHWDLTIDNLRKVLEGKVSSFITKEEILQYHPASDSLSSGLFWSVLTSRQPKFAGTRGNLIDLQHRLSKAFFINCTKKDIVRWAYYYERQKPEIEPNDNTEYCYELVIPPTPDKAARRIAQQDLERYFGIKRPKYGLFSRKKFLRNPK